MKGTKSQANAILEWLMKGKAITPIEALNEFGCFRLSARIYDLRERGYDIRKKEVNTRFKRYASYSMTPEAIEKAKRLNKAAA